MKSLRKEPGERYGSVESLAEDLKRYLDGLPVYARAGSWVYRSRKFLHRNRAAVVAATLALTSLLLFTLSSIRQERITDLQRQEAESEREKAETVADFLADLFEGAGAGGPGDRQPVLAILDRGTRRMKRVPNPHPTVQASLLEASGKAYRRMGFYDRAEPLLVESLTIRRAELGDHHLDTASSLHELGFLRFFQGKLEEGETLMLEALQLRESLAGTDALGVAESLDGLTELDLTAGINNAEDYSRRALAVRSRNLDQDHPAVGHSRARLGGVLVRHGKNVEGLVLLEEGFAAVEKAFGSQDPLTAHIAFDYGFALREVGSYDRAEKLIRLALRGYETSVGPDHPFSAACHGELGNIFLARHDPDSAEAEFRRARQLLTQRVGSDHPWLGALANHLGRACLARGDLECAAVQFRKSRDMVERMMGPESLDASFPMQYQGRIARLKGDLDEAEALLQKARTIRRKYLSESHLNFAHILHDLGRLYLDRGDVDQAEPLLRRALEIRGAGGVRGTLKLASNHLDLAEIEMLRGRHEDAVPLLEQALQGRHRVLGTEHELSLAAAEELEKARALASTPSR